MRSFAVTPHKNVVFAGNPNAAFLSFKAQDDEGELFRIPNSAFRIERGS